MPFFMTLTAQSYVIASIKVQPENLTANEVSRKQPIR